MQLCVQAVAKSKKNVKARITQTNYKTMYKLITIRKQRYRPTKSSENSCYTTTVYGYTRQITQQIQTIK